MFPSLVFPSEETQIPLDASRLDCRLSLRRIRSEYLATVAEEVGNLNGGGQGAMVGARRGGWQALSWAGFSGDKHTVLDFGRKPAGHIKRPNNDCGRE